MMTNALTAAGEALTLVAATVLASNVLFVSVALGGLAFAMAAGWVRFGGRG